MRSWARRREEPDSDDSLEPLVVDSSARGGTTMTMALLASSPAVAMDRTHPYEHAYLAWLIEWSELADREQWDMERWNGPALARRQQQGASGDGLVGPPPWLPRPLWAAEEAGDEIGPRLLAAAWREFSARAAERTRRDLGGAGGQVRYHAEKTLSVTRLRAASGLRIRAVVLHRDPRDVWLSSQAFNAARGFHGLGRGGDEGEEEWFERFVATQVGRLRAALAERARDDSLLVAYEELVARPEASAARLGRWLEIDLDPEAPARNLDRNRSHSTSASPEDSVGRWRRELEPGRRERFLEEMGPELRELGYED